MLGVYQMHRAEEVAARLAEQRGHVPHRLTTKASFANLILWKSIYEFEGRYYVDGVRVASGSEHCSGTSIEKLDVARDLPYLVPDSQQAKDVERFRWFSDDYLAPWGTYSVTDIRYSLIPNSVQPMWGITLSPDATPQQHIVWWSNREARAAAFSEFGALLGGEGCQPI